MAEKNFLIHCTVDGWVRGRDRLQNSAPFYIIPRLYLTLYRAFLLLRLSFHWKFLLGPLPAIELKYFIYNYHTHKPLLLSKLLYNRK